MNFLNLLFPRQCINCEMPGEYLCKSCKRKLLPHPEICPYCHRFSADYKTCLNCKTEKNNKLEGIIVPFSYCDLLKKLILKLKYYHKKDIGNFLSDRLVLALQTNQSPQSSIQNQKFIITYVPSHRFRHYFIKGYNQSYVLAKKLSEKIGVPLVDLLDKPRHTHTQAGLKRAQRLTNLSKAFNFNTKREIQGNETILIVDDITTTGTTINELAKIIKQHYPKAKIWGMVLGRHNKN